MESTTKVYASNRFEEIGCKLQDKANNWQEAVAYFDKSCTLCSLYDHDGRKDCASCPIRAALLANRNWHGLPKEAYTWVERELALQ